MTPKHKTLLVTLPPHIPGGVAVQAKLMANHLRTCGHDVTIAHYAAYSSDPDLTVSAVKILTGARPATREGSCFGNHASISIGCIFPELEVNYTKDSPRWRTLVESHDRHVVVGGTILAATPLVKAAVPHLIWCATDALGDRADRQAAMPVVRRLYDKFVVTPLVRRAEYQVLRGNGRIIGISPYTVRQIRALNTTRPGDIGCIPIPIDTGVFTPGDDETIPGRIGFVGRLSDARKNLDLLIHAIEKIRCRLPGVELILAGHGGTSLAPQIKRLGRGNAVTFVGQLTTHELAAFYRTLDVFVIPSHQEGLAIVGLEAMASGVPVVSTRCGGPESFVRDEDTGNLVGFDPNEMANAIVRIVQNREYRNRLSANARAMVEAEYSHAGFATALEREWESVWKEKP